MSEVAALRAEIAGWRRAGHTIGLVPTMGALHEGHLSLVRHSLAHTARTCVTLFVNPRQFGPHEDFAVYPRDEAADRRALERLGADLLFAPPGAEVYPEGHATSVAVAGLGDRLEGEFRPGFFVGVATVVAKLLLQALPDVAFFGEKDYQQFLVIRRMVRDLDIPVTVVALPTVREVDGLALSSRNAYLTAAQRGAAPALYRALEELAARAAEGAEIGPLESAARGALLQAGFDRVDYITVRDGETLAAMARVDRPSRALAAAWLGKTRLIDNLPVGSPGLGADH